MPEMTEEAAIDALGGAFDEPVETPEVETPAEQPLVADETAPEVEAEAQPAEETPVAEPEFEIEVNGAPEKITGADRIKELLQKGLVYGRGSEENARVRENLVAQIQLHQQNIQASNALIGDFAALKALDQQLEEWAKVDFGAIFDQDPFKAMKLKEQRDALREQRAAKLQELTQKQQQIQQANSQAQQNLLAAEGAALLAKLPEWRNSEKADSERHAIASWLSSQGFAKGEVDGLTDHRALLIARKAWLYDQLQSGKQAKVNQARQAPPAVKPGVAQANNGRAQFKAATAKVRELSTKGNNRAAEKLAERMFAQTFK